MSCRVVAVACALLRGGSGCGGDRFEAIGRNDDASDGDDAGPRDATLPDAGDVSIDSGPGDATLPDAGDVSIDSGPRDATLPDAGDVSIDAGPRDATSTDAVDVAIDARPRDSTLPDSSPGDSGETGVLVDVVVPPDIAVGDALPDLLNDAAGPDADGGPMAWCAGRWALFCADFDTVTAVSDGWST